MKNFSENNTSVYDYCYPYSFFHINSPVFLGIESQVAEKVLQLFGVALGGAPVVVRRRRLRLGARRRRRRQQTQQVGRPAAHVRLAAQYRSATELVGRLRLRRRRRRRGRHGGGRLMSPRRHGRRRRWRRWRQRRLSAGRHARTPPVAVRLHHGGGRSGRTRRNAANVVVTAVADVFLFDRTARLAVRLQYEQ